MTGTWIIHGLIIGGLLAGAAYALETTCRMVRWPVRWVWAAALALTVTLVGLAPYRNAPPARSTPIPVNIEPVAVAEAVAAYEPRLEPEPGAIATHSPNPVHAHLATIQQTIAMAGQRIPAWVDRSFVAVWIALSALLLSLFAAVTLHVHRMRRRWPSIELHGVRVRIADEGGPAVLGVWRTTIVVPQWLLCRSPEEQRLVLEHEREHVRARDPLLLVTACLLAALMPWHPGVWWMLSRLRLAVELDCDMRVLQQGIAPRTYGGLLIDLAGRCSSLPVGAPALADKSSHLRQRLLAMKPSHRPYPRIRGAVLGAFALVAAFLAMTAQVPLASAQVQSGGVVGAGDADEPVQPITIALPRYPAGLAHGDVTGRVELQYVVDTAGRAEPGSLKVLSRTNDAFVEAAKDAVLGSTFKPAHFRGRPVRQLVQQTISFKPSPREQAAMPVPPVARVPSAAPEPPAPAAMPVVLNELVVTAAERERLRSLGNAITTINSDSALQRRPITALHADSTMRTTQLRSLTDLLDNRVQGMINGQPDSASRLRMRGVGSTMRHNDPILIVDGVRHYPDSSARRDGADSTGAPAPSPMDAIDPNTIEKIEVFKGSSAARLYGPDAAHGVIVITTKKGNKE